MLQSSDVNEKLANDAKIKSFNNNTSKLKSILGDHFHYIKHIGSGEYGEVYLCRYTGLDENIKKLCDEHGRLCIKVATRENALNHEAAVMHDLYAKHHEISKTFKSVVGIPIKNQDEAVALLMNYVSYNGSSTDPLEYSLKSFLKSFYNSVVRGSVTNKHLTDKCHKGFYDDIGILSVQLINQMQSIIMHLHSLGYLHLDIASRNFVLNKPVVDNESNLISLSLVLCDYGLSGKLNEHDIVSTKHQDNKPITARNLQDITENVASARTDIFALKTAIIGMISLIISELMQDYNILSVGQTTPDHFKLLRTSHEYFRNDKLVLSEYFSKLMLLMEQCPERHVKSHIKYLLHYYREYLLSLPADNLKTIEAAQFDRNKLLLANEHYFTKIIDNKISHVKDINNTEEVQSLFLSLRRLLVIPMSDEFQQSAKYREILTIDNVDELKSYLAEKIKVKNDKQSQHVGKLKPLVDEKSPQIEWIDKVNELLRLWFENRKENMQEIKWFGEEMTLRVKEIINDIMEGKITQYSEVLNRYMEIASDIGQKILTKQHLPPPNANGGHKSLVAKVGMFVAGYEGEQSMQPKGVHHDAKVNASGYEGEQPDKNEKKKKNNHKGKRDL